MCPVVGAGPVLLLRLPAGAETPRGAGYSRSAGYRPDEETGAAVSTKPGPSAFDIECGMCFCSHLLRHPLSDSQGCDWDFLGTSRVVPHSIPPALASELPRLPRSCSLCRPTETAEGSCGSSRHPNTHLR